MASGGYPEHYEKGYEIEGLSDVKNLVFHAGTRLSGGQFVTSGGRVLGVTAMADRLEDALAAAYADVEKIRFKHRQFRTDIGQKVLRR